MNGVSRFAGRDSVPPEECSGTAGAAPVEVTIALDGADGCIAHARRRASDFLARAEPARGLPVPARTRELAQLVVSELVTNAIRYGAHPIRLRLIHDAATLICEVSDTSHTAPHLRRAKTWDEGGRGLLLVAQLTQRWGSRHTAEGKTIWAEIALLDEG